MTLRAAAEQFTGISAVRATAECACVTDVDPPDVELDELIDQASDVICILTGGKVCGRHTTTIYPCRTSAGYSECGCGCHLDGIPLGDQDPVVNSVQIDGVTLDSGDYTLHRDRMGWNLVRQATDVRPNGWPSSQAMWRSTDVEDTFSVTFTHGVHIDWIIERAAIELVCDFAADDMKKTNSLPRGATSAVMGNVTIGSNRAALQERLDRLSTAELGPAMSRLMGIYAPTGRFRSEVYSPELEPWTMTFKS